MRESGAIRRVGVFGLRFGGTIAAHAKPGADFALLWSPILNLRVYFRDLLRLRLTKELIHQRADQVKITARDLTAELEAGRSIDLLGYEASPDLYRQMIGMESWPQEPPANEILWLELPATVQQTAHLARPWRDRGARVEIQTYREKIFWEDFSSDFPHQFAESSIEWMQRGIAEPAGAA